MNRVVTVLVVVVFGLVGCGSHGGSISPVKPSQAARPASLQAGLKRIHSAGQVSFVQVTTLSNKDVDTVRGRYSRAQHAFEATETMTKGTGHATRIRYRATDGVGYLQDGRWASPVNRCWLRLDASAVSRPAPFEGRSAAMPAAIELVDHVHAVGSGQFRSSRVDLAVADAIHLVPTRLQPKNLRPANGHPDLTTSASVRDDGTVMTRFSGSALPAVSDLGFESTQRALRPLGFEITVTPTDHQPPIIREPPVNQQMSIADLESGRCG
jgi:hypothetical protein